MEIDNFINSAAKTIENRHSFYEGVSSQLVPLKSKKIINFGENVVVPVKNEVLSGLVSGVDSGFVSKKLSFFDIVLVRTAGVVFSFENGVLKKTDYYPAPVSFPTPLPLKLGLESDEENQSVSFERLKQEIKLNIEIIKKYGPAFSFIDGSIVPQYQDKPRKDSQINDDYKTVIELFEELYKTAEENNCVLISTVEDSRGSRFKQILQEEIIPSQNISRVDLKNCFDISLLDHFLLPKERTFAFSYTKDILSHPILKDFSTEWSKSVFVFYIKVSEFDNPLRVEFLCKNKNDLINLANKISSVVFSLSSLHKEYSYPSVLIEADLRAKLTDTDISLVYDRLIDKLGPKINMRRNNRPFG
ncbi:MAG TPA: DNA double-strand break repair nuclease NurA [archaeon]|nr:DNA double-strand break repair nuclease NurA [archaeon]